MEKEVIKKVTRYIELSKRFCKSDREILAEKNNIHQSPVSGQILCAGGTSFSMGDSGTFTMGNNWMLDGKEIYVDKDGNVKAKDPKKPLTRGEEHKAKEILKAEEDASLMDEFDEYIKLRNSLKGYFEGIDNLLN